MPERYSLPVPHTDVQEDDLSIKSVGNISGRLSSICQININHRTNCCIQFMQLLRVRLEDTPTSLVKMRGTRNNRPREPSSSTSRCQLCFRVMRFGASRVDIPLGSAVLKGNMTPQPHAISRGCRLCIGLRPSPWFCTTGTTGTVPKTHLHTTPEQYLVWTYCSFHEAGIRTNDSVNGDRVVVFGSVYI